MHDGQAFSLDELQYSNSDKFTYEKYVEFRPKFSPDVLSDPKPIYFRSSGSNAVLPRWDESKVGRISIEFKVDADGDLFSTQADFSPLFAVSVRNGFLEANYVWSDERQSSQRLFPKARVDDATWHKLEVVLLGDSIGSFILDDDTSAKIRFPGDCWDVESSLVFGARPPRQSFKGFLRNVIVNNRLIDWLNKGDASDVEAGYSDHRLTSELFFMPVDAEALPHLLLGGDGCVRFTPESAGLKESVEFLFKTSGDHMALFDSIGAGFAVFTRGPALVLRVRAEPYERTIMERGIVFNDGNLHKLRIERNGMKIEVEADNKYRQEVTLGRSTKLFPLYLGCASNKAELDAGLSRDFIGAVYNLAYVRNGSRVDLVELLGEGDPSLLVEGRVQWKAASRATTNVKNDEAITFKDASAFLSVDNIDFGPSSQVSFAFRTSENDALLALISPALAPAKHILANFVAVEMVGGEASLLLTLGNEQRRVWCGASRLNDNKWHTIQVRREKLAYSSTGSLTPSLTFSCDNQFVRLNVSDKQGLPLSVFSAGNFTGSSEWHLPRELWHTTNAKFLGCMRDLRIGQKAIEVFNVASEASRFTLRRGCLDTAAPCSAAVTPRCFNGGVCAEGFGRNYCLCEQTAFTGEQCELGASTLSFNGSQGIEFTLHDSIKSSTEDIWLRFKTRMRNGLLFGLKRHSTSQAPLLVLLEDGRIKVIFDKGGRQERVIYVGEPNLFVNNRWHTVNVKRHGTKVSCLVFDHDRNKFEVSDELGAGSEYLYYDKIVIGSLYSQSMIKELPNFTGWMQNVRFNDDYLLSYYLNERLPGRPGVIEGNAEVGENSLLLHHQVTFSGECVVALKKSASSERFNVHLYFKTGEASGVIFVRRSTDLRFLALELNVGVLRFVFDLGNGVKVLESERGVQLNDRKWHEVNIRKVDRFKFAMKVDDFK